MASCHHKTKIPASSKTESMQDGITNMTGAGVFDPYTALSITVSGNYGYGKIEENSTDAIRFYQSPYEATGMNVSVAWLRDVEQTADGYEYTKRDDLDLYVYKNGDSVFEKDENGDDIDTNKESSSTEMVYSSIATLSRSYDSEIKYDIEIKYNNDNTDNSSEPVSYGYAWSTDEDVYTNIKEHEGLYFIKNAATNTYLTYDCENNNMLLKNFGGHYFDDYEQLFVIKSNQSEEYKVGSILTNSNSGIGIDVCNLIYSTNVADISITQTNYGYYTFTTDYEYLTSYAGLCWETRESISLDECWILEKVNYRLGDVDMNGIINEYDYDMVYEMYYGTYEPTNAEMFLADINCDGIINYLDVDYYENQ